MASRTPSRSVPSIDEESSNRSHQNDPTPGPTDESARAEDAAATSPQHQEHPPANARAKQPLRTTYETQPMRNMGVFGLTRDIYPNTSDQASSGGLYEKKYPTDEFRQEMGPDARVWRVYLDEAEIYDRDTVQGWREGVDLLLVFAGLFSAVVTTFVTQTSQKLDQDFGQISASLLTELVAIQRATAISSPVRDIPASELNFSSPPQYTRLDTWINGLWFTSLILSLSTALFAVLVKQWIQHYVSFIDGTPLDRARVHQFRHLGLQRWKVRTIIDVLPLLLYIALFLFFAGLFLFLQALKSKIAYVVGAIGLFTFLLYVTSNSLPLLYPDCPYRTPLIEHIHSAITLGGYVCRYITYLLINRTIYWLLPPKRPGAAPKYSQTLLKSSELNAARAEKNHDKIVYEILRWLSTVSSNSSVQPMVLHSLSGLHPTFPFMKTVLGGSEHPGWLRSGLIKEFDRQWSNSWKFRKDPNSFINSADFYNIERIFRASLLLVANPDNMEDLKWGLDDQSSLLSSIKKISPHILLWYMFAADQIEQSDEKDEMDIEPRPLLTDAPEHMDGHGARPLVIDARTFIYGSYPIPHQVNAQLKIAFTDLKPKLFFLDTQQKQSLMSLFPATINSAISADNWQAWSNIYNSWALKYQIYPEDTPISKTYRWLGPICRILLNSRSDPIAWRTILPSICYVLPPSLVESSFGSSLEDCLPSPELLPTANIKLSCILLSCVNTELTTMAIQNHRYLARLQTTISDVCKGLEEATWACQDAAAIASLVSVLDELVNSGYLAFCAGFWRRDFYKTLCQAGFVAFMRAPLWPMVSHRHFHVLLQDVNWMCHFWAQMFNKDRRSYLSTIASQIVESLGRNSEACQMDILNGPTSW